MRDSHADIAEQLFGLGRKRHHKPSAAVVGVPAAIIARRRRGRRGRGGSAPLPQYSPPPSYPQQPVEDRPSYSAPVAQEQESAPETQAVPSEDYNGQSDEAVQGVNCCGGYLMTHATEPNIYPYENPGTRVSQLRNDRRNNVMGPGKSRNLTFEDRRPKHPPTYAQALQTRRMPPGMGHHRGGFLPFERRGMGQESTEAQKTEAARTYPLIVKAVTTTMDDLSNTRPADWDANVANADKMLRAQLDAYTKLVHEKLGDADAEMRLRRLLLALFKQISDMRANAPSEWSKGFDSFSRWFGDFVNGAKQAFNDYMAWCKARALEVLKKYYDARIRIMELKKDLKVASQSGKFSNVQLAAQAMKIAVAEGALNSASLSIPGLGSPLDVIAQGQFGKYPTIQAALAAIPAATIAAWAFLILAAVALVFALVYLVEALGGAGGIALVAVAVIGVILIAKG